MNQEGSESSGKPVLNAEGFQRLLAAAYLLQVYHDGAHDECAQLQPTVAERTRAFAAGAIVQRRTPRLSVAPQSSRAMANISASQIVEAQHTAADPLVADRISAHGTSVDHDLLAPIEVPGQMPRYTGRRMPLLGGMASRGINTLVSSAMWWRAVDAVAISAVFLAIVGVSIHGLWASRGSMPLPSGMLSFQAAKPGAEALASSQPLAPQALRQSLEQIEADVVAKDTVIRHQTRAVSGARKPRNAGTLAADIVVRYGSDVKMWSGSSKRMEMRAGIDGLTR
jgi:hypothetical protein